MPGVTFRLFAAARAAAGESEVQVPTGPIHQGVAELVGGRSRRFAEVLAISALVLDGTRLDPASADWLDDGAVVDVLPPFAGG